MTDFKVGDRVEFDARDCVNVGTVMEYAEYTGVPDQMSRVVIVETDDEKWAMHPDSLRLVEDV